jgi:hypothetical protein
MHSRREKLTTVGTKLGVAGGLAVAVFSAVPIVDLLMGHCLWEQGCGKWEGLKIIGALIISCVAGMCAGWSVMRLFRLVDNRR